MPLELKQQLKLSQQLVMTPQLQQAIKLLQLSRLELVDLVQQELEENPVLEEVQEGEGEGDLETSEEGAGAEDLEAGDEGGGASEAEAAGDSAAADPAGETSPPDDLEPTDAEKIADVDWQDYLESNPQTGMREVRDDDRPPLEATLTQRTTLSEHLLWQLQMDPPPDPELLAAQCIIGNLDDRGYLQSTEEEIARQTVLEIAVVSRALGLVQALDPPGVAARDLKECLTLQADALGIVDPLVRQILDEFLDPLLKRDFRGVSRRLGISIVEVDAAAKVIGALEPRPGRAFGGEEPVYIVPDIYVYKIGDEFHIVLNDEGLPRLRISALYREVLADRARTPKDTRAYVNDKVRSALWLIKSIHQRQRTIYKVMQSIIKFQREFFEAGVEELKPLNLRDVADDIEMHESTVSRVTTNKYAHTPQGIFELKYFFNSRIQKLNGEVIASESVKERISQLIRNEDPRRPLSDQRIAEMLRVHGIDIARRTVTKYRESLNLLSSTKRRQVG
ncbi:MAG: RNA polymerase factor sigma-54 [Myxococcota bacterium]|nr:RNA polymerase factor sigma-54 [Myxococcota bacterium]